MTLIYGCRGRAKQSWQTWSMPIRLMTGRGHCYSVRRASASPIAASFSPREVLNRSGLTASVITSIAPMAKAIHTGNSSMAMTSLHGTRPTILMSIEVTTQQSASSLRTSRSDCLNSVGRMVMAGLSFVPSSTDPFPSCRCRTAMRHRPSSDETLAAGRSPAASSPHRCGAGVAPPRRQHNPAHPASSDWPDLTRVVSHGERVRPRMRGRSALRAGPDCPQLSRD